MADEEKSKKSTPKLTDEQQLAYARKRRRMKRGTRLNYDGKVAVFEGRADDVSKAKIKAYDPKTKKWSKVLVVSMDNITLD